MRFTVSKIWTELLAYVDAIVAIWPGGSGGHLRGWWVARRVQEWGGAGAVDERVKFQAPERMRFGRGVIIGANSFFAAAGSGEIVVGNSVGFNTNVHVNASMGGTIRIGNYCMLGPNVVLRTADHKFESTVIQMQAQGHRIGDIVIGDDVWLGANVTVVGGVNIGRGAVVGAGAVVTHDVASMTVVGGIPAKIIKVRGTG